MKKFAALILALALVLAMATCAVAEEAMRVAMITDYGDITDQSFNQTTYEACKAYCEANNVDFNYFKPAGDSTAERVAMVESAIDEGYNVIVMPGYAFGGTIAEVQDIYPEVKFVALDVSEGDLGGAALADNVYCAVYQEELCGYMAGYAAVKLGYKHLGYLGGMAVPAVIRFGYGFVQGANAAAEADGVEGVKIEWVYGNQFFGDADITAYMDNWYQTMGVECVFACGGGIYTSAGEAAAKVGGKVIGVDVDQAPIIDGMYGEGMTVTSATKGLRPTTINALTDIIVGGKWADYAGKIVTLGLVSGDDPSANYVQLAETTQFGDGFTKDDYAALVKGMFDGTITVSNDTSAEPATTNVNVSWLGNLK